MDAAVSIVFDKANPGETLVAVRISTLLKERGIDVYEPPPGMKLRRIPQGVSECDRMIVVASPTSLLSAEVHDPLDLMLDREDREGGTARVIPILWGMSDIGTWVDLHSIPPDHPAFALRGRVSIVAPPIDRADAFGKMVDRIELALAEPV
jgi:hypothetical protein